MKKIVLNVIAIIMILSVSLLFTDTCFAASKVEGIVISFFASNGSVKSGNVIIEYGFITNSKTKDYKVSYKLGETITNINKINDEIFTINGAIEGSEWVAYDVNYKPVYFSESKQYTVQEVLDMLSVTDCSNTSCDSSNYKTINMFSNSKPVEKTTTKEVENSLIVTKGEDQLFGAKRNAMVKNAEFTLGMKKDKYADTYESIDPSVCTIDDLGNVKAINLGDCKIKAINQGKEYTWEGQVLELGISSSDISVNKGETINVALKLTDYQGNSSSYKVANYNNLNITWRYKDGSEVDKSKVEITYKDGKLTVKGKDTHKKKEIDLYVNGVKGTTINVESINDDGIYFDIKFLNTSSNRGANSTIINTGKDKYGDYHYLLIDTAMANGDFTCNNLLSQMEDYMIKNRNGEYNLDYVIISHDHGDHNGCLKDVISEFSLSNSQVLQKKVTNGSSKNKLGVSIEKFGSVVGNSITKKIGNVTFKIYNYKDVFAKYDCSKKITNVNFLEPRSTIKTAIAGGRYTPIKSGNKYLVVKANDNSQIYTMTEEQYNKYPEKGYGSDLNNVVWMAVTAQVDGKNKTVDACNQNANSLAILIEVPINGVNKYVYIPSDLQNNGYPFSQIDSDYEGYNMNYSYLLGNSDKTETPVLINSELEVAKQIKSDLGKNVSNIAIYQESHHGFNNTVTAMQVLGLTTNKNVYTIILSDKGDKSSSGRKQRTYYVGLGGTDKKRNYYTNNSKVGAVEFKIETKDKKQVTTLITNSVNKEITL